MTRHSRVDTTASAIIADADAFPPESTTPNKDDQRQGIYPLRVYEGYNFLPTSYGYKSYFGMQPELDAQGLTGAGQFVVEEMFVYQTRDFINVLVALTSHGIFIRGAGDWTQVVSLTPPAENTSLPWTYVTIAQVLFIYRQGHSSVFVFDDIVDGVGVSMDAFNGMAVTPTLVPLSQGNLIEVYEFVPTTINMAGQIGIYRAGGSLGFWDSDDSIAWSAISDFTDFEPSLTTLASTTKLQDQIGAITAIYPHGDGFMVYCTRSVLYAREESSALLRYSTRVVLGSVGVAYPREITVAEPDTTHYAFTSAGLMEIANAKAQPIVPDFSDYVKQTRLPQYMKMLNNRYLCIESLDPNFIPGNVEYSTGNVDPDDYKYPGSEVGGVNIPGQVLEGGKVCFSVPGAGEEDPGAELGGIKPYHLLQFYGQWLYKGAQFQTIPVTIGTTEFDVHTINPGSTDARYEAVPVSMDAADIPAFNATEQLADLQKRQQDIYDAVYVETTLKLQEKWDSYQQARSEVSPGTPRLVDKGVVIAIIPGYDVDTPGNEANPHNLDAWYDTVSGTPQYRGAFMIDGLNRMYLNYAGGPSGLRAVEAIATNRFLSELPDRKDFLGLEDNGTWFPTAYQYVGSAILDVPYTQRFPEDWPGYREILINSGDATVVQRYDLQDKNVDGPYAVLHPNTNQGYQLFAVDGAKLAQKLLPISSDGYELNISRAENEHRLLRSIASRAQVEIVPSNIRTVFQNGDEYSSTAVFTGQLYGLDEQGGTIQVTQDIEIPYSLQAVPEASEVFVSPIEAGVIEAQDIMFAQARVFFDNLRDQIADQLSAEWSQFVSSSEAAMMSQPNVNFVYWSSICSKPNRNYAAGEPTGINDTRDIAYSFDDRYTNVEYPCLLVEEVVIEEEIKDFTTDLYGEAPTVLPATATGSAAINAMTPETKRGLIAVHQHFYSNNSDKFELDPSFLITAAGRVDVPLGAALGTVPEVIEQADFANRWFIIGYAGDAGSEFGASFVVPGQTKDNMLRNEQHVVCGIVEDIVLDPLVRDPIVYPPWEIEVPELTWIMQNGSRAPFNPTIYGAYVFDLHLQKWGIFKGEYKHLLDYQPINNFTPGSVPYKNFMIDGGCLTLTNEVVLFNDYPDDNVLRYGKYQHVGSEYCAIEQIHAEFKERSTGLMAVQFSLDGRRLEYGHSVGQWYNEVLSTTLNCDIVGQWAAITLTGHFDLAGLRVKSNPSGRR